MGRKPLDLRGQEFGRLTAVVRNGAAPSGDALWRCFCECGNVCDVTASSLHLGKTRGCGCRKRIHGNSLPNGKPTGTYNTWQSMKDRCTNRNHVAYHHYGGRGIKVCERWMEFKNFLEDMGERPSGFTLDRFPDYNGNYEPGNCRWATAKEQANNKRPR